MTILCQKQRSMFNLFVYGTLRKDCDAVNATFLGDSKFLGHGFTQGVLLDLGMYPGMIEGKGIVHGEIWQTDQKSLEQMDLYEGRSFIRKEIVAIMDEKDIVCYAYFFRAKIIESGNYCE